MWLRGQSSDRNDYTNFGRRVTRKYFKAFILAVPYYFADKKWRHTDKVDMIWDIFLFCAKNNN